MKILYIHQYFITPSEPGGTRSYWISRELIKHGHEVTMITTTKDDDKPKEAIIDGIKVIYYKIPYSNKMGILKRIIAFLKFMVLSSIYVLKNNNFDLTIATSTPLTIGFPALLGKKFKKLPYIFEVRDLWPEVPVQMGGVKNKLAIKFLYWFEKIVYQNSKHVVALSPGMQDGVLAAGTPIEKVTTIPNMSKKDEFWPRERNMSLLKEINLKEDTFKVVYFGAMGLANAMDYIIDAAVLLKDRTDIEFIFMGAGAMEPLIKKRCEDEGLDFMHFYGKVPMKKLSEIVNLSDVSLVTFSDLPILATNSPNKLFDTLSAGKPIIVNSAGWTKDMVEDHNCGAYVDVKIPKQLADKIIEFKNNPELCAKMGKNARLLAENKFDKSILCDQFANLVDDIGAKL
ncbi:glycosyltransferase family 4 protein [Cellulophaga sp. HaHaR_3_176]|uniref:glycosyltransferase family 4 protein n=1 Tax=Cellulophaga sp. HaHaR_3_176 TaxID=1942464 RepID=UPI001C1FB48C|nr:glycosyltransferase family 4 protein [Cellulophaga sp. HaHaR_3_176]QWX84794.1 glycosyltransferase family 4 protein [Cellulophaga sp. HaHaR_3_176]